ncbi:hypothetical protein CK203_094789 [Vitis vinifera]|uniref:Uncharacterized protein n=1 Tax=Vitis vinifera TaxID=29760 RepID=A0A438D0H3_VITVI|nr:hypothetical protein CK203_094789 [Vitis vinifera]
MKTIKDCFTPYFQVHELKHILEEGLETGSIDDDCRNSCIKLIYIHLSGPTSLTRAISLLLLSYLYLFWQQPGHFSSIVNLLRPVQCGGSEAAAGSMRM